MGKIEELPDDFDESLNLNDHAVNPPPKPSDLPSGPGPSGVPSLESLLNNATQTKGSSTAEEPSDGKASAAKPPAMTETASKTADELLAELNRTPLFMTSLDESDGQGGENAALEGLKALAYEGTKAEVAGNFREQGNECARAKQWVDAREFYDKALGVLKGVGKELNEDPDMDLADGQKLDPDEEARKERQIEEASLVNKALCNLEMKNYRSCIQNCKATLLINPLNVKAWYRSATALLALDKIPEAEDSCERGLAIDASNASLKTLKSKIATRKKHLKETERKREERETKKRNEENALQLALRARNIKTRSTGADPDTGDAKIALTEPLDPSSVLSFPLILLYPLDAQSDFIQACAETDSLGQHLEYILPVPWDAKSEYTHAGTECYLETSSGGLIKAGKKVPLGKLLAGGTVEILDGLVKVNVVPKTRAQEWIAEFKKRKGL
ncbi:tpr repeat protein [Diplodia corticola]|uniref:Tpr repeat protein n=1 Tax=Diplodia corticola TaxID=236234 RepID=A0A1J9RJ88_9PEZI|nr:tpr repeat protein [Diplodia corticola]OJD32627.1 tpr repeat protein [Diplodia corticola]